MTEQNKPVRGPNCPPRMMIDDYAHGRLKDRAGAEERLRTHIAACEFACPSDEAFSLGVATKSTPQAEKPAKRQKRWGFF